MFYDIFSVGSQKFSQSYSPLVELNTEVIKVYFSENIGNVVPVLGRNKGWFECPVLPQNQLD